MLNVLELYSGIGGMHQALLESGIDGKVLTSIDINPNANLVYKHNFPETPNLSRNIQSLSLKNVKKLGINAIFMSPPCQPFTRVGLKKDTLDERTSSLFHVLDLISQSPQIQYILVENVRGFETSDTRNELVQCLQNSGFNYKEFLLSPCQFGIPNSRQRYYLIAKRKNLPFLFQDQQLAESLPESVREILPKSSHEILAEESDVNSRKGRKCYSLKHILEEDVGERYRLPLDTVRKRWSVLDVRHSGSNGSCCFTKAYSYYLEGTGSVFCPKSEEEMLKVFGKLKGLDDSNPEYLELLADLELRFFTPKEVSRLMCFSEEFTFPDNVTDKQKYKLLGNSINVFVVSQLIRLLCYEGDKLGEVKK